MTEDHLAEAISHTKEAIEHGKQGHADILVTHTEAALKHAEAAEKTKANPHTKEGITHLEASIREGKKSDAIASLKKPRPPETIERYLKAAERHIAIGRICIARQRAIIARLEGRERHGELRREATRLLGQLLKIQTLHLADRDRLICELSQVRQR